MSTGWGAVKNTAKVEEETNSVAVFGIGAVGLAVIEGISLIFNFYEQY